MDCIKHYVVPFLTCNAPVILLSSCMHACMSLAVLRHESVTIAPAALLPDDIKISKREWECPQRTLDGQLQAIIR